MDFSGEEGVASDVELDVSKAGGGGKYESWSLEFKVCILSFKSAISSRRARTWKQYGWIGNIPYLLV